MTTPTTALPKTPPPQTIPTPRLLLRKHELALAETMFAAVDQDRARLARFLPWVDHIQAVEDERNYIARTQTDWQANRLYDYGIFTQESNTYLGNIGVHHLEWSHHRCEIGYWLIGAAEGQGFITEAVQALEQALFSLGMHRIEIRCSSLNHRSAGVPVRLGYRLEGTLRECLVEQSAFRDVQIYGKLRSDAP